MGNGDPAPRGPSSARGVSETGDLEPASCYYGPMLPSQRRALIWIAAIGILVALLAIAHPHVRRIYRQYVPNHAPSTGRLANPEGLAIDSEGTFYVGNQDSADFVILDPAGKVLKRWNVLEGYHNGKGEPSGFCRGLYIVVPEPG